MTTTSAKTDEIPQTKFLVPHYRVSTDDKGQDPMRQDAACRPWATREGFVLLNPVVDNGTSAFKTLALDRPKFMEACERAKAAGCEGILLESPDRFSRVDPWRAIWEMVEIYDRFGLTIYFASASLELQKTFAGKLLLFVQLAMSHDWAQGHANKVQLGMERKKEQGVRFGRKPKELTEDEWRLFDDMQARAKGFDTITVEINSRRILNSQYLPTNQRARVETLTKTTLRRALARREKAAADRTKLLSDGTKGDSARVGESPA